MEDGGRNSNNRSRGRKLQFIQFHSSNPTQCLSSSHSFAPQTRPNGCHLLTHSPLKPDLMVIIFSLIRPSNPTQWLSSSHSFAPQTRPNGYHLLTHSPLKPDPMVIIFQNRIFTSKTRSKVICFCVLHPMSYILKP